MSAQDLSGEDLRTRIIGEARAWIGTPYRHQASLKGVGCDCLGLVRGVWRAVYGAEPEEPGPYQAGWAEAAGVEALRDASRRHLDEISRDLMAPGDLLLFRWQAHLPAKHLGILTEAEAMVHAHERASVAEVPLGLWARKIAHVFRFPG